MRGGGVGLGLDLGLLEHQLAVGDGDLLLGGQPRLLGRLTGVGLGDGGGLPHPRGFWAPEVGQVGAVVGDVLDLEGVEHQPLTGQGGLRLVGDPLRAATFVRNHTSEPALLRGNRLPARGVTALRGPGSVD